MKNPLSGLMSKLRRSSSATEESELDRKKRESVERRKKAEASAVTPTVSALEGDEATTAFEDAISEGLHEIDFKKPEELSDLLKRKIAELEGSKVDTELVMQLLRARPDQVVLVVVNLARKRTQKDKEGKLSIKAYRESVNDLWIAFKVVWPIVKAVKNHLANRNQAAKPDTAASRSQEDGAKSE